MKKLLTLILPLALLGCTMSGAAPASRNIRVVKGETPKPTGKKYTYTESWKWLDFKGVALYIRKIYTKDEE